MNWWPRQDLGECIWIDGRENQNEGEGHDCMLVCAVFQVAVRQLHGDFTGCFENTDLELKGEGGFSRFSILCLVGTLG